MIKITAVVGSIVMTLTVLVSAQKPQAPDYPPQQEPKSRLVTQQSDVPPTPRLGPGVSGLIPNAVVRRDLNTSQIRRVEGSVVIQGARTPREAATQFLQTHKSALGLVQLAAADLRPTSERKSLTGTYVTYAHYYSGLPVFNSQISVEIGKAAKDKPLAVTFVNQDIVPIRRRTAIVAARDPQPAIEAAVAALKDEGNPMTLPKAEAGVLVRKGIPLTAWRVSFDTPGAAWEVMVNASTRNVLSVRNIARYAHPRPGSDRINEFQPSTCNGTAMIYWPNPVQSSGDITLSDNNNADSPALTASRTKVTLHALDCSGRLIGLYATTATTPGYELAQEPNLNFNYTRGDSRFEMVMAYHWVTEATLYLQRLGFVGDAAINKRQIGLHVDYIDPTEGELAYSYYSPATKGFYFGTVNVDGAEDADTILHEYGHSIHDDQVPNWGSGDESSAMGEGFGDYWAASFFAGVGARSGAWDAFIAEWRGIPVHAPALGLPGYLRRIDGVKHYPQDLMRNQGEQPECHADGEIWSAALWQIRNILGRQRADIIIVGSHYRLTPTSSFADGAEAILYANKVLYNDRDRDSIRKVFVDRGILAP